MRILHLFKTSFPDSMGGVEQVIHQIAQGASKRGVETDVLSLSSLRNAPIVDMGAYKVHRAYMNFNIASTGFSISAFSHFSQLIKEADVVHYHFPWPFMDILHFVNRVQKPSIVTYHSDIVRQKFLLKLYSPLQYKFLSSVTKIVATSPPYVETSDVLKKFPDKVDIVPIGLDKSRYPIPRPERLQYWREKLGETFFLFVGVLRYYKGLHILLDAAQGLEYPIVIVGDGPLEQTLKAQVQSLGLRHIYFLGSLTDEDKVALLMLCYGFLFPSHLRSEAFGISLLEAAMYGKPMISCEIGTGTTFINLHKVTGLVVPPDNATELREAMRYLWEHPQEATDMGIQAEERYWELFTADRMVESYVDLYNEITSS